ncbi:MAG: cysteine--tRNA ligase [Nanoarchaeota archaeon]|nr:cysteine--tRNA ligase [Nanoarchaeota archaeon]
MKLKPLKLYNTLTKKKETFKPIKKGFVGIYTCGPTVYWYQHIGNLRSYLFPDILKRVLKVHGYKVKQVINVTDVGHLTSDADEGEDKMERAAKKEGKSAKEISNFYFKVFKEDLKKMNIESPDYWPKATEHIKEQIELIKKLEKKGYTYQTSDGIYFDTSKLKDYGKLANVNVSGLKAGKRVAVGEKKSKTDFALWKFSDADAKEKRQQEWKSPWGVGFPGWHIECSAMSMKYLGEHFDIHTGGQEHIQIHHSNEIAQSEAATGKPFVNYWLHGEWLTHNGEKISKSKGGLYTLSELEKQDYSPMDLRYFFLSAHYRKPLSFSLENLDFAKTSLKRLKDIVSRLKEAWSRTPTGPSNKNIELAFGEFMGFLDDDLNMSRALSYLWEILRDDRLNNSEKYELAVKFDEILGLGLDKEKKVRIPADVKKLAEIREKAREEKKWEDADQIRRDIENLGYIVEDSEEGFILKEK